MHGRDLGKSVLASAWPRHITAAPAQALELKDRSENQMSADREVLVLFQRGFRYLQQGRVQRGHDHSEHGATVSALAREFKTSRNTIMRVRDAILAP